MQERFTRLLVAVALVTPVAGLASQSPAGAATVSVTPSWTVNSAGWDRSSSPTIADVNGDGRRDIVIGHEDGRLHVIDAANGRDLPGWPQQTGTAIDSTPAVGDLFENGSQDIVVGLGSTFVPNQQGGVAVYNAKGSLHCIYRTADYFNIWHGGGPDGYADGVYSSPAIGDINGDGHPDIVFGGFDLHIHAIDRNCHQIMSDTVEDTVWSSPALYDVNGDGRLDILIGGDQTAGGAINWSGGEFRAIEYTAASTPACSHCREIWKRQVNDTVWSSPAVGDVDGDGRPEVVVGGGDFFKRSDGKKVFAWHVDDGSVVPGWPVSTAGSTMPSPALGDLGGNGIPEVVVGSADGWVRTYNGNGSLRWATKLYGQTPTSPGGGVASPIIADFNGDGRNDVGRRQQLRFLRAERAERQSDATARPVRVARQRGRGRRFRLGSRLATRRRRLRHAAQDEPAAVLHDAGSQGHCAVADVPSGRAASRGPRCAAPAAAGPLPREREPVAHPLTASSKGYWVLAANGALFALKGAPFFGGPFGHVKGTAVALAATHSGNGYYALDNSGDIFPFGDAHSFGSMAGKHLNQPIIALAPTPSGRGYWLLASDGGVFSFGDARFFGSTGNLRLNKPIISIAATHSGRGYWLLASDGGVFSFGDARFHGSTGNLRLNSPVISMAAAPSGAGYWLVAGDGGIFSFGVPFYGSVPGLGLCRPASGTQIRPSLTGHGYFVVAHSGEVFGFGDAQAGDSTPSLDGFHFAVDLAVRP